MPVSELDARRGRRRREAPAGWRRCPRSGEGPHAVDDRRDECQRAGGGGGRLAGDVGPDGQGVAHRRGQAGARQDGTERIAAGKARRATPGCASNAAGPWRGDDSNGRSRSWIRETLATNCRYRRPRRARSGRSRRPSRSEVGMDAHDRPVGRLDLVNVLDPPHRDESRRGRAPAARKAHSRPGRSRRRYGPASKRKPVALQPRRQAAEAVGRLDHARRDSPRRASRRAAVRPPMPAPMTSDCPAHRGCLSLSNRRMVRRPRRSRRPSGFNGGNARSSISGTNSVPRPLPQT